MLLVFIFLSLLFLFQVVVAVVASKLTKEVRDENYLNSKAHSDSFQECVLHISNINFYLFESVRDHKTNMKIDAW